MKRRKLRWSLLFAVSACTGITSGSTPVAIEWVSPVPSKVVVGGPPETLQVVVHDRADNVLNVPVTVMSLEPNYLTVDSLARRGDTSLWRVIGDSLDSGRVVARHVVATTGNLQSIPLTITVDSI